MPAGVFRRAPRSLSSFAYLYPQPFPTSRDDLYEKCGLGVSSQGWKQDEYLGVLVFIALEYQLAAMIGNDAVAYGQAQTGSFAGRLG